MKVGILTFHRSYNYGAFMQCFSLYSRLKKDFPSIDFEIIDYTSKRAMQGYEDEVLRIKDVNLQEKIRKRNIAFDIEQETLHLSKECFLTDEFDDVVEYMNKTYDAVVVGSDAVWNWNVRGFPSLYFLKDYKGFKFSYAASVHGMNYQNITYEQRRYVGEALEDFKYIGVRDITTEKMVKFTNEGLSTFHNCDPTMFLDLKDVPCEIDSLKDKLIKHGVDFSKPIVGIMANNSIGLEIKKKYKDKIQLVALYTPNKYADVFLYDLSPFEWANVFSFFKVTLTHFFHGTMLSLVNGVPVIPIEFVNEFSAINVTKIKDLMDRLDLSDWRMQSLGNKSILSRIMHKMEFPTNYRLWKDVYGKMDEFFCNDYFNVIKDKRINESKSYNSFYEAMKNNLNT